MKRSVKSVGLKHGATLLILSPLFFLISYTLTVPYVKGDQEFYRAFYTQLTHAQFSEIMILQLINTGSAEPLYGILMWIGSNIGIDKDVYIGIFNTVLFCAIFYFLRKNNSSILFASLVLSNYYLVVMLTSAERLKFSYIALTIAALQLPFGRKIWGLISIFFHFQSLILISSKIAGRLSKTTLKRRISRRNLAIFFLGSILSIAALAVFLRAFSGIITAKLLVYANSAEIFGFLSTLLLMILSVFIFKSKKEVLTSLAICALFSIIVGPERVNMIAVTAFIYFVVTERKTSNPLAIGLMLYFSVKTIDFVQQIFQYGNGYHEFSI